MPDLRNPRPHRFIDDVREGNGDSPTVRMAYAAMRKVLDGYHDGASDARDCGLTDLSAELHAQQRVLDVEFANQLRAMAARHAR